MKSKCVNLRLLRDQRGQTPADVLAKQKRAAVVSWLVTIVCNVKCIFINGEQVGEKKATHSLRFDHSVLKVLMGRKDKEMNEAGLNYCINP